MIFEELDRIIGGHAPFLMSLSDGSREELRLVIAAAEVGELGADVPDFSDMGEATKKSLCDFYNEHYGTEIYIKNLCEDDVSFVEDVFSQWGYAFSVGIYRD